MGHSSPTMLQTLLILSKLYDSGDTDIPRWMSVVESHPRLLTYYLTALDPHQFDAWADGIDPEILRDLALTFLNFPDHDLDATSPARAVSLVGRLADLLAP